MLDINVIGIFDNLSDEDYLVEQNTRLLQRCSPILDEISFQLTDLFRNIKSNGGLGSTGA